MERRELMAGDLATISGTAFIDLTDNGFNSGVDPATPTATIYLYRDGGLAGTGNGTNNSSNGIAGGDDALIGTVTTNASGAYSFTGLAAGTYFLEQDPVAGLLQRASESVKTIVISEAQAAGVLTTNVDSYNATGQTVTAAQGATANNSSATALGEAIGDERDIFVTNTGAPGANDLEAVVAAGVLAINTGAGAEGSVVITYDGVDNNATTIDHTNLSLDLTAGGGNAFLVLASSEPGNTITVNVYSGAADFSTITANLPVTGSLLTFENLNLAFGDFTTGGGGGADFTNVTAIRISVAVAQDANARIDFSQIVTPFVSTQNFANLNPMSLGNLVFVDSNNNGVRDTGEVGVQNVTIQLFEDSDLSGGYTVGDALVDTETTDSNGNYVFSNLLPGEYVVVVPLTNFATGNALFGHETSTGNNPAPDPDLVVTDNDDNGAFLTGVGVVSAAITLASGTEPTTDGDTNTNSNLTVDFGFAPQIDLSVDKVANAASIIAGNNVTYTLTVTNEGDATATNVVVVDNLPDFMTIVSAISTAGGVVTQTGNVNGEVSVAFASLAPAASATITIVATIPAGQAAATGVVNTATVTGNGIEQNNLNNTDTANIDITRNAVLTITKTDTPDPNIVGAELTYTILVTNTGPSTATNVEVIDTLPAGLTFDEVTTSVGTASQAAGVITATIPTLAVGASATVTIVSIINANFTGSTISNTATAESDEGALVTSAAASTTVNPQVNLSITKSDSADPVNRGDQLVYTLDIANAGPSGATNVQVIDTLPAGVTFVSAVDANNNAITPTVNGQQLTFNLGNMAASGTASIEITVDVAQSAGASLTNTATVQSTESLAGFDTNINNNSDSETTTVRSAIDLSVDKTGPANAVPGEALVYTIVVSNNGPSNASSVQVTDNIPDGIRIVSASSSSGTVNIPASAQDTTAANNEDLTVTGASIADQGSITITINAVVLPATRGNLVNSVTVASTDTAQLETITNNNSDSVTSTLTPNVDLSITKVDSPTDNVVAGNQITYTMLVTNNGTSTATNVTVSDTLPSNVTFVSAISTQGTATQAAGVVTGNIGTLAPGASATVTLVVAVNPATRTTVSNTATTAAAETEAVTNNNSATATTTVVGTSTLTITKTDQLTTVAQGSNLTYTIVVTNTGPSTATDVIVTDTMPTGVTFSSGSSTVGTVSNVGNAVTATVGTLAPGASATITLNATVSATAAGTLTNTATADSTESPAVQATDTTVVGGSINGVVYIDANRDGVISTGEAGIPNVAIALSGTDTNGNAVTRTTTTNANGQYSFTNLAPGTYTITQTQPGGFTNGSSNVGTGAGGTAGTNTITTVNLTSGTNAQAYNFGEIVAEFSKRRFLATPV